MARRALYRSKRLCKKSLKLNQVVGDPRGVICCVAGFGAIAVAQKKYERAAQLLASVESQLALFSIRLLFMDKMEYERNLILLRAHLNEETFAGFWARGKAMTFDETVAMALAEV